MRVAVSGEINMAICSENLAHTRSKLLEFSFAQNGGKELAAAHSDDSGILQIALVPFQSYSGHPNVELAIPSIVEDAPQIV